MAWTYDPALLQSTDPGTFSGSTVGVRYQIRLLIQDNQETRPLMQDEEIDWFQTTEANAFMAAAKCCDSLVARGGSVKTKTVGDLSITYDVSFYAQLSLDLKARGLTYQVPSVGGVFVSDKLLNQQNPNLVTPFFARDLDDNPGAPQPQVPAPNRLTDQGA